MGGYKRINPLGGGSGGGAVDSVNGQTGVVVLDYTDVGADPAGTAATLVAAIGDKYVRTTRFAIIGAGTNGTVALPANSTVVLDDFGGTTDAVVSTSTGGFPTVQSPQTAAGAIVATSFDASGNYVFTGTPSAYPVAILYRVRQKLSDFDSTASDIYGNSTTEETPTESTILLSDVTTLDSSTTKHGFLKKLSNVSTEFMNGVGSWAVPNLLKLPESLNSAAPNGTVTVAALTATDAATNVDVSIVPKGTGAFQLSVPDNATAGGNKRGANSIDLQTLRSANTQVASGGNAVVIGANNAASNSNGVAIGFSNNVTAASASAIGNGNSATGTGSVAVGQSNLSSGANSFSYGNTNTASGQFSSATGKNATTFSIEGRRTHSTGNISEAGDNQHSYWHFQKATTDATPAVLHTSGGAGSATTRFILQNYNAFAFKGLIVAIQDGTTTAAAWNVEGLAVRGANAAATSVAGVTVNAISNVPAWTTPTITADTTNGAISITVTGVAATNIRWVADIETSEVIYT